VGSVFITTDGLEVANRIVSTFAMELPAFLEIESLNTTARI
jgi:hypothetical protein